MKKLASVVGSLVILVVAIAVPAKSQFVSSSIKDIKAAGAGAALNCGGNGTGGL